MMQFITDSSSMFPIYHLKNLFIPDFRFITYIHQFEYNSSIAQNINILMMFKQGPYYMALSFHAISPEYAL